MKTKTNEEKVKEMLKLVMTTGFWKHPGNKVIEEYAKEKNLPLHMYCADNEENVRMCIEKGADLITANDPAPLMRVLGRL